MKEYDNNLVNLFIYKSKRKNAQVLKAVTIRHLIPNRGYDTISDERILDYFISTLDECVYAFKKCKYQHINARNWMSYGHVTGYIDANGDWYEHVTMMRTMSQRDDYSSLEGFINHLYRMFLVVYPYSKLDITTIYANTFIKHIISNYYQH